MGTFKPGMSRRPRASGLGSQFRKSSKGGTNVGHALDFIPPFEALGGGMLSSLRRRACKEVAGKVRVRFETA